MKSILTFSAFAALFGYLSFNNDSMVLIYPLALFIVMLIVSTISYLISLQNRIELAKRLGKKVKLSNESVSGKRVKSSNKDLTIYAGNLVLYKGDVFQVIN